MKNKLILTVLTALACLALAGTASAVSIGAGPSTINFGQMVKGGYAEETITVSTSGDEDLTCVVEFTGDLKDWLSIDKGARFELPADSRLKLKAVIQPPADARNGEYEGAIYIKAAPTSTVSGGAGLIVGAGVKMRVYAEVTGEEIISYKLMRASVSDTEVGYPIKFTAFVRNNGNIKVKPEVKIEVFDVAGNPVKTFTQANVEVLPTVESSITVEVPSDNLAVAPYTAMLSVGDEEQVLSFNILQKGTLAMKGILKRVVLNKIWVEVGETVKISGEVENTGELLIEGARIDVEVYIIDEKYQTEKLVKPIRSRDELDIPVGQTVELVTYFTPSKPGRYMIRGVASYAGKKTPPKSTVLNVMSTPQDYTPMIILAVVVVVVALWWLTKKGEDGRTRRFKKIWGDYLQIK